MKKIIFVSIIVLSIFSIPLFFHITKAQTNTLLTGTKTDYFVGDYPINIAFDNVTNSVWVVNQGSSTISKINIYTGDRIDYSVDIGNLHGIAFDNITNSVWVTNANTSTVSKININTGAKTDYTVGINPYGVAFDNVTNSVWVANGGSNTISKINAYTGTRIDYAVGSTPSDVTFDNITNSIWVTNAGSGTVSKININTGAKTDYTVGSSPEGVTFDNITNSIWVTNAGSGTVSKININTGAKTDYTVGINPYGVAFDNVTNSVWVTNYSSGTISKINIYTGDRTDYSVGVNSNPHGITFDNVTNSVWVVNYNLGIISKIAAGVSQPPQLINPTDSGTLKEGFNPSTNHYGIDIDKTLYQRPVKSPTGGTIVKIDPIDDSNAGKWIWIYHGSVTKKDGSVTEKISTRYLHMDTIDPAMFVGKQVAQGEIIGTVGTTGLSTAPHLHFEVRQGDIPAYLDYRLTTALDPLLFVDYAKSSFSISAYSPIDVVITDPDGFVLSKTRNDFNSEADYFELTESDENNSGDIVEYEIASIDNLKDGNYVISVVPEPNAQPDDVYTLKTSICGVTMPISENTPVKYIPDSPYIIRSTGCDVERIIPIKIITPTLATEYLLNSVSQIQFNVIDNIFGTASISATLNGEVVSNNDFVTLDKSGLNTLVVTATDNSGHSTTITKTFSVTYINSGFLPPVKSDGTGIYNQGRTLPVKFQLTDVNNNYVSTASASLYVSKVSDGVVGTDKIPLSVSYADTDNNFRYDASQNQYVYNLSTGALEPGTWQLKAVLGSGQTITAIISIK